MTPLYSVTPIGKEETYGITYVIEGAPDGLEVLVIDERWDGDKGFALEHYASAQEYANAVAQALSYAGV